MNKKPRSSGEHEVHNINDCQCLPDVEDRYTLGLFKTCQDALEFARSFRPELKIDGCQYCSSESSIEQHGTMANK